MRRPNLEKSLQRKSAGGGFSTPELLIVVLIVAILVVLSLPQLGSSLRANRVNTLNALVASKLADARLQAIKRNSNASVKIDPVNRLVWIEVAGGTVGASERYSDETDIVLAPAAATPIQTVTFNSFGNLHSQPVTISINAPSSNLSKPLQVSLTGRIKVMPTTAIQP